MHKKIHYPIIIIIIILPGGELSMPTATLERPPANIERHGCSVAFFP
jgi:hypothetical protein